MEFFAKTNHKLSENSTKVTVTGSSYYQNAFGNVLIRSSSRESHCWQFKILRNKESYGIDIGIVEDDHLDLNNTFTSKGFGYGLCSNGNLYSATNCTKNDYKLRNTTQKYRCNDIVLMKLDLCDRTLSFVIDSSHQQQQLIQISGIKVSHTLNYTMAVYLSDKKDSIKLLGHTKTRVEEISEKHDEKQMIHKLQHEYKVVKAHNHEQTKQIHALQDKMKAFETEIDAIHNAKRELEATVREKDDVIRKVQNELKEKQEEVDELERLSKSSKHKDNGKALLIERIDKLETENRSLKRMKENLKSRMNEKETDLFRVKQQNEEYKESNKRQQSRILVLKKENQSLRNNRDQTQRVNLKQR
eukprot:254559_1